MNAAHLLSPSSILLTAVTFTVEFKSSSSLECILISGNSSQLGNWDLDKAIKLTTTKSTYPIWSVTVSLPSEITVEYKYIVKAGNKIKKWEGFSGTRSIKPTGLAELVDDGKFSPIAQQIESESATSDDDESTSQSNSHIQNANQNTTKVVDGQEDTSNGSSPSSTTSSSSTSSKRRRSIKQKVLVDCGWLINEVQLRVYLGHSVHDELGNDTFSGIEIFQSGLPTSISSNSLASLATTLGSPLISSPKISNFSVSLSASEPLVMQRDEVWQSFQFKSDESFVLNAPNKESLSFSVDLISKDDGELLGRAHIDYSEMSQLKGHLVRSILSPTLESIGRIRLTYLVITSFTHPMNNLSSSLWQRNWGKELLFIGHRGSGATNDPSQFHPLPTENTLLSFLAAARLGADYIEFDVQLTKDQVPIIAHDEEISVLTTSSNGSEIALKVPINKLKLSKLRKLKPVMPEQGKKSDKDSEQENSLNFPQGSTGRFPGELRKQISLPIRRLGRSKSTEDIAKLSDSFMQQHKGARRRTASILKMKKETDSFWESLDTYPTLEQVFKHLPLEVGFNVEIKYPDEEHIEAYLSIAERNEYVDKILRVIFDNAKQRHVIISSFDPEVCLLCAVKQICYPVFFLTTGGRDGPLQTDGRKNSIERAIQFAVSARLAGIVSHSAAIVENFEIIKKIHKQNLLIFTYGHHNADPEHVRIQKEAGVDAVICDKVFKVKKASRDKTAPLSNSKNPYVGTFWLHKGMSKESII